MNCEVIVENGTMSEGEKNAYIQRAREKFGKEPRTIHAKLDGEFVELTYDFGNTRFQRLRRITGYLVGDMGRWNDGKKAEEKDRVKHSI